MGAVTIWSVVNAAVALAIVINGWRWWASLTRLRDANDRLYQSRLDVLALRDDQLEAKRKQLDPLEALEARANDMRDRNEVLRFRIAPLEAVAVAAQQVVRTALVQRDPHHPTVHAKPEDFEKLCKLMVQVGYINERVEQ